MKKFIIFIFTLTLVSINIYAENIKVNLLSQKPKEPKVGQQIYLRYTFLFPKTKILNSNTISYISTEEIQIKKVQLTQAQDQEVNSDAKLFTYYLDIYLLVSKAGIHSIPHIQINDEIIILPHLNIVSVLHNTQDLRPIEIKSYTPLKEIINILISSILLLIGITFAVKLLINIFVYVIQRISKIKSVFNLLHCLRKIDEIIKILKNMGSKRKRKYFVSFDCYTQLMDQIKFRLSFYYPKNFIQSLTSEEIGKIFIYHLKYSTIKAEDIQNLFLVFDMVFYANKKYPVQLRLIHSQTLKKMILELSFESIDDMNIKRIPNFFDTNLVQIKPL